MAKSPKAGQKAVQRGYQALERGRSEQALLAFREAVAAAPRDFRAQFGLARSLQALGEPSAAIDAFEAALKVSPADGCTLIALGQLARDLKAPEQAAGFFRAAALSEPGSIAAQAGLAHALRDLDRQEEAIELLQSALSLNPEAGELWTTIGQVMADLEDFANAEIFLNEALRLDAHDGGATGTLAEVLFATGRRAEARATYDRALALRPGDPRLRFNHALFALATGDVEAGWRDYEARLDRRYPGVVRRDLQLARWNGRPLPKGRLLVVAEQGVGDELHFLHCVADTAALVDELWWECDPRLVPLFSHAFPAVRFVPWQAGARPGIHRGYDWLEDAPRFDAYIEAGSLQTLLRRRVEDFPATPPLLSAPHHEAAGGRRRIGISWTSVRRNRLRDRGYVTLEQWEPIFALPDVDWVNLQYGEVEADLAAAEARFGVRIERNPAIDLKDDFLATAALTASCDLVIAPTNTARQLAASLGVPSFVFNRLPYEFALGQKANPFFSNMIDFVRLPERDWTKAVVEMARRLAAGDIAQGRAA